VTVIHYTLFSLISINIKMLKQNIIIIVYEKPKKRKNKNG